MRTAIAGLCSLTAVAFAIAVPAYASDYEGETLGAVPPGSTLEIDGPLYVLALDASDIADGASCAPNCPDNGTKYQLSYGEGFGGSVFISAVPDPSACTPNCDLFDLVTMDVAERAVGSGPITLIFQPVYSVGGGDLFFFVTDGIIDGVGGQGDFETIVFDETFLDLESVVIVSAVPYMGVAMDNIIGPPPQTSQPVPALEPFGLGALALTLCTTAVFFGRSPQRRIKRTVREHRKFKLRFRSVR